MSIPTIEELLTMEITSTFDSAPLPVGRYNAVITKVEVRKGPKGPYLVVETTVHDEEYQGRKTWGQPSFSERALKMPGGIAQLVQAAQPVLNRDLAAEALPAALAEALLTLPVIIEVGHEQVRRGGVPQVLADGSPEMRARVVGWESPSQAFIDTIEREASGLDDDLPF